MPSFNVLTDVIGGQDRASNKDTTLPYDIRAEIDWHDFACTANPLGAPERIKDAIASAIAEGAMTFRPDKAGVPSEQQSGALLRDLARMLPGRHEPFGAHRRHRTSISSVQRGYTYACAY